MFIQSQKSSVLGKYLHVFNRHLPSWSKYKKEEVIGEVELIHVA